MFQSRNCKFSFLPLCFLVNLHIECDLSKSGQNFLLGERYVGTRQFDYACVRVGNYVALPLQTDLDPANVERDDAADLGDDGEEGREQEEAHEARTLGGAANPPREGGRSRLVSNYTDI